MHPKSYMCRSKTHHFLHISFCFHGRLQRFPLVSAAVFHAFPTEINKFLVRTCVRFPLFTRFLLCVMMMVYWGESKLPYLLLVWIGLGRQPWRKSWLLSFSPPPPIEAYRGSDMPLAFSFPLSLWGHRKSLCCAKNDGQCPSFFRLCIKAFCPRSRQRRFCRRGSHWGSWAERCCIVRRHDRPAYNACHLL